ncbi:hypothetical protein CLV99_2975 [Sphingobacterium yanglingense]|uniref:Uncharacterized protein n=1 Tax=Sphingobacterium yanglingense TaxID=1437280 RepID=A0A4R6WAL5_9SPHI|nr:hypothetical protein CLV99_2975 [Sphingobacterium yanglingense]
MQQITLYLKCLNGIHILQKFTFLLNRFNKNCRRSELLGVQLLVVFYL